MELSVIPVRFYRKPKIALKIKSINKRNAEFIISENISRYAEYKLLKGCSKRKSFQEVSYCFTIINWYMEKKSVPLVEDKEIPHLIPCPSGRTSSNWCILK